MKFTPYSELLKDPRWQKKRLKILEYAEWRCQFCGKADRTLHVHHSYYTKGKMPWQYPDGSLVALCDSCHEKLHPEKKKQPELGGPPVGSVSGAERFRALREWLEAPEHPDPKVQAVIERVRRERPLMSSNFESVKIRNEVGGYMVLECQLGDELTYCLLDAPRNKAFLQGVFSSVFGRPVQVSVVKGEDAA